MIQVLLRPVALSLPSRDFVYVRERIQKVIRLGREDQAREATVRLVDEWAVDVIAAHIGTQRLPLQTLAEFIVADRERYFGFLGKARNQSPEVSNWVMDCNFLMRDRVRYWMERASRFNKAPDRSGAAAR